MGGIMEARRRLHLQAQLLTLLCRWRSQKRQDEPRTSCVTEGMPAMRHGLWTRRHSGRLPFTVSGDFLLPHSQEEEAAQRTDALSCRTARPGAAEVELNQTPGSKPAL